tara:strand:+ start:3380 stop:5002 length:1623 start_codon:yes stop_codon:yes gene_type:complete
MEKNDSYLGNPNVKRDGVVTNWTNDEVKEYARCMQDPAYFAKTYCKVIHLDKGLVPFDLYPYQEKMFNQFNTNRFNIVLACRQSGKSISSVAYLLWFALFNSEKVIAVMANKGATAREMLGRVTLMLENLPFFLQPGCKALNKGSIEFSNNSRIVAAATSGSSIRGMSVNLLYLDEFAFVERASEFYTSTYPVVSSGKDTKVIITSTANGIGNVFHKIWEGAIQKTNEFIPFRVDWWDVPGRDEEWKKATVANTSPVQFDQEFGNTFFGTGDTLINANTLLELRRHDPLEITKDNVKVYNEPIKDHNYVMLVDVAKGRGQDYSTFSVIDISAEPFKQVAVYRNNLISPLLFPNIIYKYANSYNQAMVVIESNDAGMVVCNGLYHDLEYENMFVESAIKADALGILMTRKVKRIGCSSFKDLLENNKLEIVDEDTIIEISTFTARGSSYEASDGNHDDIVMNLIMFGYFAGTSAFGEMTDISIRDLMFQQRMQEIENDVLDWGFVDDGLDNISNPALTSDQWQIESPDQEWMVQNWDGTNL